MNKNNPPAVPEAVANSFATLLAELGNGECQNEASEKLVGLVQDVSERFKAGTLTITLKVRPAGKGRLMNITWEVVAKPPPEEKEATFLYANEDGLLQKTNPDQKELPLRALPETNTAAPKEIEPRAAQLKSA
jgi:hypothetical protein